MRQYVVLLTKHIDRAAQDWPHPINTIYFGGGTPSLLSPQQVAEILESIYRNLSISDKAEISIEANPGTVTLQSLSGYRNAGVNRVSLGLQSCSSMQLEQLGRIHTYKEGRDAVTWARQAGFDNLSVDLMFALPGQTIETLEVEIKNFLEFQPEHLSCYGLTAEPNTPFHDKAEKGELGLPDEEFYADAFVLIHDRLTAAGYEHYEIANYGKTGYACRHNLNYWQRQPYLGLGAGAHSFFADEWGSRWQSPADLDQYRCSLQQGKDPLQRLETFSRDSALSETIYLALRTRNGVSNERLMHHFGTTLEEAFPEAVAQNSQWLVRHNQNWAFTPEGWLLFDRLILPFL